MNEQEIAEINRYCDPYSILIVTSKRRLIRLKCPFQVEVIRDIDTYVSGDLKYVDAVRVDMNARLVYSIEDRLYSYSFFRICLVEDEDNLFY